MDLQLDLLENSYDFLNNALFYYNKANLDDGHEEGQADLETKIVLENWINIIGSIFGLI